MIKNKQKGFTLIELLVVIAIIGILSGTVVVSMSGAQDSAKNSRIKAGMDQMRSWAEVHRLLTGSYVGFKTVTDGKLIDEDIASQGKTLIVVDSPTEYCMSVQLYDSTTHYCMDSKGVVKTTSATACVAATGCP